MNPRQFTVLQVFPFGMNDLLKTLGEHSTWNDAITHVFDATDRKNTIISESCTDPPQHHIFRFNDDGAVVSVDHICNNDHCMYGDLESLNR